MQDDRPFHRDAPHVYTSFIPGEYGPSWRLIVEGPQKHFLSCRACGERFLVEIPEHASERAERTATCPHGHEVRYDERTALGSEKPAAAKKP